VVVVVVTVWELEELEDELDVYEVEEPPVVVVSVTAEPVFMESRS